MDRVGRKGLFMKKALKKIPSRTSHTSHTSFKTEAAERAFWESNDSMAFLDWSKAHKVTLPNLKPTTKTISRRFS